MRLAATFVVSTILLVARPALAGDGNRGSVGWGAAGGAASGNAGSGGSAGGMGTGGSGAAADGADHAPDAPTTDEPVQRKWWELGLTLESHRLIRQNDLNGAAPDKFLNFYEIDARFALSKRDTIRARWGFYERFIADDGETGLRGDDVYLNYYRAVPLPEKFDLTLSAGFTLPASFSSQKQSLITTPNVGVLLERRIGDFTLGARAGGRYYWMRYATSEGGAANPRWQLTGGLEAEYQVPIHKPLTFGIGVFTAYRRSYQVPNANDPSVALAGGGYVQDATFTNQPVQQTYGGQIFARYTFPAWKRFRADATLAYGQGDPTIGYTSILHDGVSRFYGFYRQTSEVYASLSVRY